MASPPKQPSPSAKPAAAERPDLSRLRIDRGAKAAASRGFPWVTLLIVAVIAGGAYLFRDRLLALASESGGTLVTAVRALKVAPGDGEGKVAANGYIVADRTASLATVLSGRLVELNFGEGDRVAAGDVVARIQFDDYEAEVRRSEAALHAAEQRIEIARTARDASKLNLGRFEADVAATEELIATARENAEAAEREVERNRGLYDKKRIDGGAWDRVQTEARVAALRILVAESRNREAEATLAEWRGQILNRIAALKAAEEDLDAKTAEVEYAKIQLDKTIIRAPFAGLVIRKDAEVGEVLAPTGAGNSRGSVVTIVEPSTLEVEVELSEKRILRVHEGDRATVRLDADPDTGYPATVRKIWPRADRSKGTIELRVAFDAIPSTVRPDMAARVVFDGKVDVPSEGPRKAFVRVPQRTVVSRGDDRFVFVIEGDVVRRVPVVTGASQGPDIVVDEGLEGGERLVLDPPSQLSDGDRVRIQGDS